MARARLIKPGFFANVSLSQTSAHGRLLFVGLWALADRAGRLKDEPRWIKGQLFPYENVPVDKLLSQLADLRFIERYKVDDQAIIQVVNFEKHQRPHANEPESTLSPKVEVTSDNVRSPSDNGASTSLSIVVPVTGITDPVSIDPEAEAEAVTPASRELRRLLCLSLSVKKLTPFLEEEFTNAIAVFGDVCLRHSINEAARYNKLSWAYIQEIMKRHADEGCPPEELANASRRERMIAGMQT